ncbi:putative phage abortive infection protein [Thalassobellus sediminis]|uniref:putative phage abortive infection protein n=1 Tax=Thalassobellus sediminis TaxID=3367753 RepID=UPI00379FDEC7
MLFLIIVFVFLTFLSFGIFFYLLLDKYNPRWLFKVKWNNNIVIISFFLLFVSSLFLAGASLVTDYFIDNVNKISTDYTKVGAFGDLVGGILNPAVAFIGIIAASLAFYAQYRANVQVQKQFQIQQFESQFYEMLRLHKENVNEMRITGYDVSIQESIQEVNNDNGEPIKNRTTTKSQTIKYTESRKVFVTMHTELIALYQFLEFYNEQYKTSIEKEELLTYAYKLFFFGIKSEIPSSEVIDDLSMIRFKNHLNNVRNRHRNSNGKTNVFERANEDVWMTNVELYIKYSPFSGHESRLGHYYRHLYSTVKFVVSKEGTLFDYKQIREYLRILRSQMSNDEQLMLYYNCIIGFGQDWEINGFLTKYRMIHNLPVDKVKYATHPRDHFREYINSLKKEDGPLFEWGDN